MPGRRLLFLLVLGVLPARAQNPIADITEPVLTPFALYQPDRIEYIPAVPDYAIQPDFSDVVNFDRFYFSDDEQARLQKNHFFARKGRYSQFYDSYNACTWNGTPVFVTTDAVLHIYHTLFDRLLRDIEVRFFMPALERLITALIERTEPLCSEQQGETVREAALRNLAYLHVARCLLHGQLENVPLSIRDWVQAEWELIQKQEGYAFSPIFGSFSALDYSRFKPRGHYTQSNALRRYFQTLTWFGKMIFTMEPEKFPKLAERHTLQAVLLTQALCRLENEETPLADYEQIIHPTNFFIGPPDDPAVLEYRGIAEQIYGPDWLQLDADTLADAARLSAFMDEAQKLPEPEIPNWIYGSFITYKGFRFMGQRTIPDSYLFSRLVMPYVDERLMPMGLDVMAVLGSERAAAHLDTLYQQTRYANYGYQRSVLGAEFAARPAADWAQNLYWNWLYTLLPLLTSKGSGYPVFMQSPAWADKELMTALASWAELRHDTILYAKQSTTPCCIPPGTPRSYVEPNPQLYARLGALLRYTRDGLEQRDLLPQDYRDRITLFDHLLAFLRDVAVKELQNEPLSDSEYDNIFCFGDAAKKLLAEFEPNDPWNMDADDMAVIADVHTDSNTDQCLQVGVAYPLELFVIVREGGITRITVGTVFSYYEFNQPISER
ncbi:DUF3160 domain-containing protein, partial [candidate division KSB1 bacterium]|nr:DUF3160 domain-containing protein [candidate division KSB1 bacterium]